MILIAAFVMVLCGCASAPSYDPGRVQPTKTESGRRAVQLAPIQLKKMWDSEVTLGLLAVADVSSASLTIRRSGAEARVWNECRTLSIESGDELLDRYQGSDLIYESDLIIGTGTIETVTVSVGRDVLQTLAGAAGGTLRVCDDRFPIDELHRQYLSEFLASASAL
jgi:hypothetical protein